MHTTPHPGDPLRPQHAPSSAARSPLLESQMRAVAPSIFASRQAPEPIRPLHLHPDHRGPARPAARKASSRSWSPRAEAGSPARASTPST